MKYLDIVGLIFILALYFLSGINKLFNFSSTAKGINEKFIFNKLPILVTNICLACVILVWIIGSILLVYAKLKNKNKLGIFLSLTFLIFTLIITGYYHNPIIDSSQKIQFLKNLSIMGSFILTLDSFLN
jgi:hypothetical protein